MAIIRATSSFGLGSSNGSTESVFSKNHLASDAKISVEAQKKIASMGLQRVAGNAYICESTKDFWSVKGNAVVRMTMDVVDNGESLAAAPSNDPAAFLAGILDDLSF